MQRTEKESLKVEVDDVESKRSDEVDYERYVAIN